MNAEQFINNDGNEINTYELVKVKLYFANADGDKLIAAYREKHYSTNTPLERFVVEELIAGPSGQIEGLYPVQDAGPNACPPMVVGVGIGGTFEKCALMAKDALTREVGTHSDIQWVKDLEEEMLETINKLGIGPGGLGGTTTALAVNVNTYPTHIAGLPVGINICCHVNRHIVREV